MADNSNASFTTSTRKYTSCLGVVEFDLGRNHYKRAVIAHFTETTVITRGLTSPATDASSLEMASYDFWYGGSTSGYTHCYFDYESTKVVSECRRTSEAGFYEKTTTTTTCDKVETFGG